MNTSKSISLRRTASRKRLMSSPAGLRPVLARRRPWRIAACALAVFVVSISVASLLAKTAAQRAGPEPVHLTKAGKKWVAATLRSLSLEEKIGQMLMGRKPLTPKYESVQAVGSILIGRHHM